MKQDSVTTWARPSPRTTRPLRFLLWALPVLFLFDLILGGPLGFTFGSLPLRHILFGGATFSLAACWLLTQGRLPRAAVAPLLAIYLFLAGNLLWVSLVPALLVHRSAGSKTWLSEDMTL